MRTCRQFHELVAKLRPGQKIAVTYKRGNNVAKAEITLGESKR